MSHRPHPTKGPGHWYITIETREPDPVTGKTKRKQSNIPFEGSEAEAAAFDSEVNGKKVVSPFPSVLDILPRFLSAYQNNTQDGTYKDLQYALKRLLPYFGDKRIPLLLPHHFEDYKSRRLADTYLPGKPAQLLKDDVLGETAKRKTVGKRTINRELTYLKALLTFAEEQGVAVPHRPKLFPKKQAAPKAIIVLSPDEISAVLEQLHGDQKTLASLMFWCGLRKSEAQHLRIRDIDLANNAIVIHGKGGKIRIVPILDVGLAGDIKARLKALKGKPTEAWLVPNPQTEKPGEPAKPYGSIMKSLRTACEKAGVTKHVYHHLLRHTFGTTAMVSGMQQRSIQGMMGHGDSRTTERYTHLAAQFLQTEGAKLTGLIGCEKKSEKKNDNE